MPIPIRQIRAVLEDTTALAAERCIFTGTAPALLATHTETARYRCIAT